MRHANLLRIVLLCWLLAIAPAAFAQVNHGDFMGGGVDFLDVTETTQTAGDPAVLWEAPTLAGAGNDQLLFLPSDFTSTCASGTSDITSSLLTTTIESAPGNSIGSIALVEAGDVTLTKFPPFGDPTTNANVSMSGFVTVIEASGAPIAPVVIPFLGAFVPTGTFSLPGDFGAGVWTGSMMVDVEAQVPNATKAVLSLDNNLATNCGAGNTTAKIQKKSVSGPSVALIVNPVECDLALDKTCCVPTPPSPGIDICEGKINSAVFEVTGGTCADTSNDQEGKAKCSGPTNPVLDPGNTVDIALTNDEDKIEVNGTLGGDWNVPVGSTIEFTHVDPTKELPSTIEFEVSGPGGTQSLEIHTSCSKSLSCGDQFGSVKLVELDTTEGGLTVCTEPDPNGTQCLPDQGQTGVACEERPVEIIFEYTGAGCQNPLPQDPDKAECHGNPLGISPVSVAYTGKDPGKFTLSPSSNIAVGDTFAFTATGRDEMHSESQFLIQMQGDGGILQNLRFHTSCSQPLACGDEFGSLKIVEFTDKNGTRVSCNQTPGPLFQQACEVPLAPPSPHCTSKVMELQLAYIGDALGEGCTVSNSQEGNASCTGVDDPGSDVSVTITKDADKVFADPSSGIAAPVPGMVEIISIFKEENGERKELPSSTEFDVSGPGGTQSIELHTSCSKPLNLGDRFGSFAVVGIDRKEDGFVGLGGQIEYQYAVTNNSAEDAVVTVTDDPLGTVASGETVAAGATRTFFATSTLYTTLTNTATVMGTTTPSGAVCNAPVDMVTVDVTLPPAGSFDCSDAKPIDELTMIWNPGPGDPQDVCVRAFDGDVGDTQLGEQDNVGMGDLVRFNGMGGSPNDQQWAIYAAGDCGGALLGTSNFHISCSDDNMNGIEDCGKDMGNSKDDDPAFVNTWLFEGMKGDEVLECTPGAYLNPITPLCGFGYELVFMVPGLMWLRRRMRTA